MAAQSDKSRCRSAQREGHQEAVFVTGGSTFSSLAEEDAGGVGGAGSVKGEGRILSQCLAASKISPTTPPPTPCFVDGSSLIVGSQVYDIVGPHAYDIVGSQSALSSAATFSLQDGAFNQPGAGSGSSSSSSRSSIVGSRLCGGIVGSWAEPRNLAERIERDLELLGGGAAEEEDDEEGVVRVGRDMVLLM